jgi:hypothetical protein
MPHYFLLHDPHMFQSRILPAFASSWQDRSFEPVIPLAIQLRESIAAFGDKFRMGVDEPILELIARGMKFNRDVWEMAFGESLFYGAKEAPDAPVSFGSLRFFLGSSASSGESISRSQWHWIDRALLGSHSFRLGRAIYRPNNAGWNTAIDSASLATLAGQVIPQTWQAAQLEAFDSSLDEEDRVDELALAHQALQGLRAIYNRAIEQGNVVICEQIT